MQVKEEISSLESANRLPETEKTVPQKLSQNIWLMIILVAMLLGSTGIFAYKYFELRQQVQQLREEVSDFSCGSAVTTTPSPEPITTTPGFEPSLLTFPPSQTADWQAYRNKEYGYEFKYPKNWRIADSVMKWYKERTTNPRFTPSIEDWIMVTNLSAEDEVSYLEALKNYDGIGIGIDHIKNADGRAIEVQPTTNTVEELKENQITGWDYLNFREVKNNSGLVITRFRERVTWEMDRDYEVALVPYLANKMLREEKITYLSLKMERNDGNYESEVFDQILSTFRFVD